MIYAVHQPQYLPWLGFFDKIDKSDCFVYLDRVQYKHREYQNRNRIRTIDGWIWLSVPVLHRQGVKIAEVMIDNTRDWRSHHLKSLKAWYSRCEYFDKYFPFFENIYSKTWEKLMALNIFIAGYLLESLGIRKKIYYESRLDAAGEKTERIINIGKALGADTYLSGQGGKDYLDEDSFARVGLKLAYQDYKHPAYRQQYAKEGKDFLSHLSVIDLLFNEGERSLNILRGGEHV